MAFNKSEYDANFMKTNYDRIYLLVPKGKKESIVSFAKEKGMSISEFIYEAITEKMDRESAGN